MRHRNPKRRKQLRRGNLALGIGLGIPFGSSLIGSGGLPNPAAILGSNLEIWDRADAGLSTDGSVQFQASNDTWMQSGIITGPTANVGSISCWFNGTGATQTSLARIWGYGAALQEIVLCYITPTTVAAQTLNANATPSFTPTPGVWYHALVTWDTTNGVQFFINGTLIGATATLPTFASPTEITLGKYSGGGALYFNGNIDALGIWSNSIPSQAAALYNSDAGLRYNTLNSILLSTNVAYYDFDQPSNLGLDSSPNGYTLTLNGISNPTYVAGHVTGTPTLTGEAVSIIQSTGVAGAVDLVAASSQSFTLGSALVQSGAMTVSSWVNFTTLSGTEGVFSQGAGGAQGIFAFGTTVFWTVNSNGTNINTGVLSTGTWYHIVGVYDGTNISMYVNGALVSGPTATTFTANPTVSYFGLYNGSYLNGGLDACGVWNTNLNSTQITALYNSGAGLNYSQLTTGLKTNLVSYYDFDQPTNLGLDGTGNYPLTPVNAPTPTAGIVSPPVVANNNNATQTTGSNRYLLELNQINGLPALQAPAATGFYALASAIPITGPFTLYWAVNQVASGNLIAALTNTGSQAFGYTDSSGYQYLITDAVGVADTPYTGISGFRIIRIRRNVGNHCYLAFTGGAEVEFTVGSPLSGTFTLAYLFGNRGGSTNSLAGTQDAELFLANVDTVTSGQDAACLAWLKSRYNLTVP